jgi:penicillin-binding protein 1A
MPDPNGNFSAGPRLAATSRRPEDRPKKAPKSPKTPKRPRQGGGFWRFLAGFLVNSAYRIVFLGIVAIFIIGAGGFIVFSAGLPSVDSLKTYKPPLESRVYADNFQLVAELANEHRIYVPYDQIPPIVAQAFVSAEDRLFWVHPGINPAAILRAGLFDLTRLNSGHRPLGASTITEQVVKNMLLDNNITFAGKIKEAILALRVEQVMTKRQILALYLNEIYLGNNSYGIAAAAQAYFDKPLGQLDIAQAASLASLPKAPSSYDPFQHPQQALDRRNFVISRMLADGAISAADAQTATAEPLLPEAGGTPRTVPDAGYFSDAVQADLVQRFGADAVGNGGLIVHTSLKPGLQAAAINAVRDGLEKYDHTYSGWHGLVAHVDDAALASNWQADLGKQTTPPGMRSDWQLGIVISATDSAAKIGYIDNVDSTGANTGRTGTISLASMAWARPLVNGQPGGAPDAVSDVLHPGDIVMVTPGSAPHALLLKQVPNIQAALICMDPKTGRILAMVGGWSHDISPFNRATQAQRQPGSSVKPLVYLTAMEQGIQPDAPVLDAPFVQQLSDGTTYRPGNYEETFQGPVPIFHALEQSLNLATLHLARTIGLDNVAKTFEGFGIVDTMPPYYPSAIGAIDTTLWKMTTAYAALDEYGRQITPSLIDSVTDPDGQVLYESASEACDNCVSGDPSQPPQLDVSGAQLADPDSVFQIVTMMKGVVQRGTGAPAVVGITQPVAGKTGTTNNFNDAWFIGFTPGVLTGCWIGFDKPQSLGKDQTGGNVCGPIWNEFMKVALADQPDLDFAVPSGVTLQQTSFNGQTVTEAFKANQVPGAQSNDSLLAGQNGLDSAPGGTPNGSSATPGAPAASGSQPLLGGLY